MQETGPTQRGDGTVRYKAVVAYDGTGYYGFQRQNNAEPTVQGVVEAALTGIAGEAVSILGAGRTDAGVHASGQVIAFDMAWHHPVQALRNALNANLPEEIAVRSVAEAADDFHPRYDAVSRSYCYRVYVSPTRDPMRRWRAWHLKSELDQNAIRKAVAFLGGEKDFSTFGRPPIGENPVREVFAAEWDDAADGEQHFTITANAFLYRMVRSIMGTLVMVGQGRMTPEEFRGILAARKRSLSGPAAPPHGLTLVSVTY